MDRKVWWGLGILGLLLAGLAVPAGRASHGRLQEGGPAILSRDLYLSGSDFAAGESTGPLRKDAGLSLTLPASAVYTSPVILAPMPFSDLGCLLEGTFPPGSALFLEVRSSPDETGDRWTAWEPIEEEDDLPGTAYGEFACELYFVPQRDGVHRRFRYRLSVMAASGGDLPSLDRVTFNFIDARAGPTTAEIMSKQGPKEAVSAVERPAVISREEWGCPEGEESPRWPPEYARVTHVIVHHTATPNDDTDWAARVRAIWYYHANTRGWGDIGYNFVIDPLGNVYEGRAGSGEEFDLDVVGGHAKNYNYGTMGIGNLGTYSNDLPPAPLQESLEALIAWKASRRGIDPLGSSFNSHKVYDHIAGHRDVGQTSCPGDALDSLLPTVRQNVLTRLLQQEETTVVDELDPEFARSEAYWHDGCGREGHSWWTHTTTDPALSANWGIWRPDLPLGGRYEVFAYIPSCSEEGLPEYTESAHYKVYYRGGGSTIVVNQKEEQGRWVSLGTYEFYAGTSGYLYLDDIADDHWRSLWYDAVRWVLREPSAEPPPSPLLQSPTEGVWLESRRITFSWTIPATATVDLVNLVVARNADLSSPLVDIVVDPETPEAVTLPEDAPVLYWSVRAHNGNGYGEFAPVRSFGVDTAPPVSTIQGLYRSVNGTHFLLWVGQDAGSGVAAYTVQMRRGQEGPWEDLWVDLPWTSGVVDLPEGVVYFRVHARDLVGHREAPHGGDGDLSSEEVSLLEWGWFYPLVLRREEMVIPTRPPTRTPRPSPTLTATPLPTPTPTAGGVTPLPGPPTETPAIGPAPTATATETPRPVPTETPAVPPTVTRLPSPTPAGTASALPDLEVVALHSSQDSPFDCGRPAGIAVTVRNGGAAAAGPFLLQLEGEGAEDCRWRLKALPPGGEVEQVCPTIVLNTVITATVDVEGQVAEADEMNNVLVRPLSVLVLPTCTPTPP